MNHDHQLYRDRRARAPRPDARACRRRARPRADRAGGGAQPRFALSVPPRQLFYYLSGFAEPEAVVALVAGPDGDRQILFCREKNEEREIWDGFRYGPDAAREIFGFDAAHPISELDAMLPDLASEPAGAVHADRPVRRLGPQDPALLNEVRGRARTGVSAPEEIVDVRAPLDTMRLVKDAHEIGLMRRAAAISTERAPARDGAHAPRAGTSTRSKPSSRTSSCATARRPSPIRRSSPAGPTPACCTTATTTGSCRTASCC